MVQESMVTMESFSLSLVAVGSAAAVVYLCVAAWVSWPRRVGEIFRRQGIDGPPPSSFLMGNLSEMQARVQQAVAAEEDGAAGGLHKDDGFDDYCKRIFPYFDKWRKAYESWPIWESGGISLMILRTYVRDTSHRSDN
ncbi:hypothetical protein ACQJBY_003061 [Aegilops geniculata]